MGMGFGMIGAIGGAGAAMDKEGDYLYKQDEANAADTRQRSFQDWLMSKQQEYKIADEQRADTRIEAQKDRDFQRQQVETGPRTMVETKAKSDAEAATVDQDVRTAAIKTKAGIVAKAEGDEAAAPAEASAASIKHKGASADAAATADTDAAVTGKIAQAKETPSTRAKNFAEADYYSDRNQTSLERANGRGAGANKLDPADAAELKEVQEGIKSKRSLIDKGRAEGSWDDKNPTPGQQSLQSDLIALQKRERDLLAKSRSTPAPDPLNLRGNQTPGATNSAGHPMVKVGGPADSDQTAIYQDEYAKTQAKLAKATDPDEKARFQNDLDGLQREMKRLGIQPGAPGSVPAAAPAPVAAPAPSMIGGPAPMPAAAPAPAPAVAKPPVQLAPLVPPPPAAPAAAPAAPAGSARAQLSTLTGGGSAPAGGATPAPGAGSDRDAAVQKLKAKAAGGASAAPAQDPLLTAMGAEGGSSIAQQQAAKAPQLRAAADAIRAAQADVVTAGKSGQAAAVQQAMQKVQAAAGVLDNLLKDMNPAQATAIKKALGVV